MKKVYAVLVGLFLGLTMTAATAAGGITAAKAETVARVSHSLSAVQQAHSNKAEKPAATPAGAPSGCDSTDFCVYAQGNGGDLCMENADNIANMGSCANIDQSVFNNGTSGDAVSMHYESDYDGAWTCIKKGDYWLYTSDYIFNSGSGDPGYDQDIADNVASFHWQAVTSSSPCTSDDIG